MLVEHLKNCTTCSRVVFYLLRFNYIASFKPGDLFISMDFDTMIYLSVKPRLLLKNVDFSNRQRLKVS